ERLYPLWWWITVPAAAITGVAFVVGLAQVRHRRGLNAFVTFTLLSAVASYVVFDALAPSFLQGAAPRYVIYALPAFLVTLGLGAIRWRPLIPGVIATQLAGLACLFWPQWSYGGLDLANWPRYLKETVNSPQQTCIVTDGRASEPVNRYAPPGSKIDSNLGDDCLNYQRVLLVSDDFRLEMSRPLDEMAKRLRREFDLVSNMTVFPAQITVYERSGNGLTRPAPGRLALPEQDLRLPLEVLPEHWRIDGFARLDEAQPVLEMPARLAQAPFWIPTNYRSDRPAAP